MSDKRRDNEGRVLPENVVQRKDGTYMWRKTVNGKSYCIYANTLGEIKQKRNIALGDIESGTYKGKLEKMQEEREHARQDMTLNEWYIKWEQVYRFGNVKESTLQNHHAMYMRVFSDTIGRMRLKDIKQIDITEIFNQLSKDGKSYKTITLYRHIIYTVLNDAVSNGLIEVNPADGALKVRNTGKKKEKHVLSEQEEERFFEHVKKDPFSWDRLPLLIVGFNTGMRIGEMLALTWDDIDFENNIIHVNKNLSKIHDYARDEGKMRFEITTPKTKTSVRDIPMLPKAKEALLIQKRMHTPSNVIIDGYRDFVFTSSTGNVLYDSNVRHEITSIVRRLNEYETAMAKAEEREPVYFERFSPHCMRHTFATRCYEKGVKEKVIQKILGHSKLDMTLNVYTHVTENMIEEDMEKMK